MSYYLLAGAIGLIGGICSGLFGVGGGVVMVPAMVLLMGLSIHTAVGTSLIVIIPTAMMGAAKHHAVGNTDWKLALALAPLAIAGGYCGAWLANEIPAANLKRMFGGFLVLVGVYLFSGK